MMLPAYKEKRTAKQIVCHYVIVAIAVFAFVNILGLVLGWTWERILTTAAIAAAAWLGAIIFVPIMTARPKRRSPSDGEGV